MATTSTRNVGAPTTNSGKPSPSDVMGQKQVIAGRHHADVQGEVVVFPIGMKINRWWAIHRWFTPMINTIRLWRHVQFVRPDGYLSGYLFFYARGVGMMQYWRDFESLEEFARDSERPHLAAWRQLVSQTSGDQTFGYWHETYVIDAANSETIYGSMTPFGLGAAVGHASIDRTSENARSRLDSEPAG